MSSKIVRIEGRGLPLRGHDIDTDRIIPARFLRAVRFEGLEAHIFEDDRASLPAAQRPHPFDDPRFAGAKVLVVNRNFGCGSSREHAPQAIVRWGLQAVVGESFSEIFFGNAIALGLPCVSVTGEVAEALQAAIERDPAMVVAVDLGQRQVRFGDRSADFTMASAAHEAFVSGHWDATGLLLDDFAHVEAAARRLPYVHAFRAVS